MNLHKNCFDGLNNFSFRILLSFKKSKNKQLNEKVFYWEERFIKRLKVLNPNYGYNINANINKPPTPSKEARKRAGKTLKARNTKARVYLKKYNDKEIVLNDIPDEFKYIIKISENSRKHMTGKKYTNTDCFKVPHTKTKAYIDSRKAISEKRRNEVSFVEVYREGVLLGIWRSSMDLQDDSLKEDFVLKPCIKSRFSKSRSGKPVHYIQASKVNRACKENFLYKGLSFKFKIAV